MERVFMAFIEDGELTDRQKNQLRDRLAHTIAMWFNLDEDVDFSVHEVTEQWAEAEQEEDLS